MTAGVIRGIEIGYLGRNPVGSRVSVNLSYCLRRGGWGMGDGDGAGEGDGEGLYLKGIGEQMNGSSKGEGATYSPSDSDENIDDLSLKDLSGVTMVARARRTASWWVNCNHFSRKEIGLARLNKTTGGRGK